VYPAIIQSAFGMFSCKKLADGSNTFSLAWHLDCDSDEAHVAQAVGAASLAVWGVGFPLLLAGLIHRLGNNAKYSFVIVSHGYKHHLQFWEAWECLKKFGILLISTFLRNTPELAAIILILFLCFTMVVYAKCEPFVSSLVNRAHIACEFLVLSVLLAGLLSTSTTSDSLGKQNLKWPEEVASLSIVVVSFAACLLAGFTAIGWLETGSICRPGGRRQGLWDRFVQSRNHAVLNVRRLSEVAGFSAGAIVPEAAPADSASADISTVEIHSAVAAGAVRNHSLPAPPHLPKLETGRITAPNQMHIGDLSMATNSILADVDDGNELKMQLEKCVRKWDALGDNAQLISMKDDLYELKMQLEKCARKLETLAGDDGLTVSPSSPASVSNYGAAHWKSHFSSDGQCAIQTQLRRGGYAP
jgi:hypothetical protein